MNVRQSILVIFSLIFFLLSIIFIGFEAREIPKDQNAVIDSILEKLNPEVRRGRLLASSLENLPNNCLYSIWVEKSDQSWMPLIVADGVTVNVADGPTWIPSDLAWSARTYLKSVDDVNYIVWVNKYNLEFYVKNIILVALFLLLFYLILVLIISLLFRENFAKLTDGRQSYDNDSFDEDNDEDETIAEDTLADSKNNVTQESPDEAKIPVVQNLPQESPVEAKIPVLQNAPQESPVETKIPMSQNVPQESSVEAKIPVSQNAPQESLAETKIPMSQNAPQESSDETKVPVSQNIPTQEPSAEAKIHLSQNAPQESPDEAKVPLSQNAPQESPVETKIPLSQNVPQESPVEAKIPLSQNAPQESPIETKIPMYQNVPQESSVEAKTPMLQNVPQESPVEAKITVVQNLPQETIAEAKIPLSQNAPQGTPDEVKVPVSQNAPQESSDETKVPMSQNAPQESSDEAKVPVSQNAPQESPDEAKVPVSQNAPQETIAEAKVHLSQNAPQESDNKQNSETKHSAGLLARAEEMTNAAESDSETQMFEHIVAGDENHRVKFTSAEYDALTQPLDFGDDNDEEPNDWENLDLPAQAEQHNQNLLDGYKKIWAKSIKSSNDFRQKFSFKDARNLQRLGTSETQYLLSVLEVGQHYFGWTECSFFVKEDNKFIDCKSKLELDTTNLNIPTNGKKKGKIYVPLFPFGQDELFGYLYFKWNDIANFKLTDVMLFLKFIFSYNAKFIFDKNFQAEINKTVSDGLSQRGECSVAVLTVDNKEQIQIESKDVDIQVLDALIYQKLVKDFKKFNIYQITDLKYIMVGTKFDKNKTLKMYNKWILNSDKQVFSININQNFTLSFSFGVAFKSDNVDNNATATNLISRAESLLRVSINQGGNKISVQK